MEHCLVKILTNWVTAPHTITPESTVQLETSQNSKQKPENPKLRLCLGDNTVLELGLSLGVEGPHHAGMAATLGQQSRPADRRSCRVHAAPVTPCGSSGESSILGWE